MSKNNKASNYNEKMLTRLRIQFIVLSMAVVIIMQDFMQHYGNKLCIMHLENISLTQDFTL